MFDWDKFKNNDPSIMPELLKHIASGAGEMSYVAHGPIVWCERWDDMGWFDQAASCLINYRGWRFTMPPSATRRSACSTT